VAGPAAVLYFLLVGAVIGLVTMFFTFTFLPWRQYTEPLILDDFVAGAGFGLFRILVPLLMAVLLAARAGAAVSADVSTRVAGRQVEAMRAFGAPPARYLRTGALWAFLIGTPLLGIVAFLGARAASAAVFAAMAPDRTLYDFGVMFGRFLGAGALPEGTGWVAAKEIVSAFLVAVVAYGEGAREKRSPEEVARAVTRTVIRATALVLLAHAAFAVVEF
jgi:ABC-type transporter Mla maintaining outer membrane lipid asymmetry permease subunit MlaE